MSAAQKLQPSSAIKLIIGQGPYAGQVFEFSKQSIFIGRSTENDLVLADDAKVSRRHAEIKKTDLGFEILNLSEKNNIYINGDVRPRWLLKSGERIVLGQTDFTFVIVEDENFNLSSADKTSVPVINSTKAMPLTRTEQTGKSAHHPPLPSEIPNLTQSPNLTNFPGLQKTNSPRPIMQNQNPQAAPGDPSLFLRGPQPGHFGAPPLPPGGYPRGPSSLDSSNQHSPILKIVILIVVLAGGAWFFLNQKQVQKKEGADLYRTFEKVQQDIQRSQDNLNAYKEKKEKLDSSQYRRAQEHLVKGLRDYRQSQFARARDSFRLVLNLDPDNEVAKRYYQLSSIKFDEMLKFHMRQGMSYREKNNFRLCKASYANAMKMINNPTDATYKEAEQYLRECELALLGRF